MTDSRSSLTRWWDANVKKPLLKTATWSDVGVRIRKAAITSYTTLYDENENHSALIVRYVSPHTLPMSAYEPPTQEQGPHDMSMDQGCNKCASCCAKAEQPITYGPHDMSMEEACNKYKPCCCSPCCVGAYLSSNLRCSDKDVSNIAQEPICSDVFRRRYCRVLNPLMFASCILVSGKEIGFRAIEVCMSKSTGISPIDSSRGQICLKGTFCCLCCGCGIPEMVVRGTSQTFGTPLTLTLDALSVISDVATEPCKEKCCCVACARFPQPTDPLEKETKQGVLQLSKDSNKLNAPTYVRIRRALQDIRKPPICCVTQVHPLPPLKQSMSQVTNEALTSQHQGVERAILEEKPMGKHPVPALSRRASQQKMVMPSVEGGAAEVISPVRTVAASPTHGEGVVFRPPTTGFASSSIPIFNQHNHLVMSAPPTPGATSRVLSPLSAPISPVQPRSPLRNWTETPVEQGPVNPTLPGVCPQ